MTRTCHPFLLRSAAVAVLLSATAAHARPDEDGGVAPRPMPGFIPPATVTFDIPADPDPVRWRQPHRAWTPTPASAYAASDPGAGAVTGQRDITGAGSVAAALQSQTPGFVARTGVTFDIPADPYPGFAQRWDRTEMARRAATGKAQASLGLTELPWFVPFWQSARIEASFDPQGGEGTGQLAAVLSRAWSFIGLTGSSEDRYTETRGGLLGPEAPVTSWEIGRTTRLELPWHTTALLLGSEVTSADRRFTGSIGAEQTLFGRLKASASLVDLGGDQPGVTFTAGFSFNW
ncbi:hypothetical protein [Inquilinus limosus]|uniref:Transporter n=1 Tax=Inquilinus limosus MP06 TaxID=1398085 RepID=A0A0A0CY29_9PROT|nr:hypothetical protein [Inquilinus limosus]KGM30689.1 hypothetical protein P409_31580 [Inquilinus limosus MP06]